MVEPHFQVTMPTPVRSEAVQVSTTGRNSLGNLNSSNSSSIFNVTSKLCSVESDTCDVNSQNLNPCYSSPLFNVTGKLLYFKWAGRRRQATCRSTHEYTLIIQMTVPQTVS